MKVVVLCGSLRRDSYNGALLREAVAVAPPGLDVQIVSIHDIPLFNEDVESAGFPASVASLRALCGASDAILIATPEYNSSMPGVLKNTVDWLSRAPAAPLSGKFGGVIGASQGMLGTSRSQVHLRQVLSFLNVSVMNKPEVLVARAQDKFDAALKLTDEATRKALTKYMVAWSEWLQRMMRP